MNDVVIRLKKMVVVAVAASMVFRSNGVSAACLDSVEDEVLKDDVIDAGASAFGKEVESYEYIGDKNVGSAKKISNPVLSKGSKGSNVVTWDCVWFGNYWQEDTNKNGIANKSDAKQPIKWRVLSVEGDDLFLLADKVLEEKEYNYSYATDVTWETSTIRSWLNGYGSSENKDGMSYTNDSFLNSAFDYEEKNIIKSKPDKVTLLSYDDAINSSYGFSTGYSISDNARAGACTTYLMDQYFVNYEYDGWWLSTLSNTLMFSAMLVDFGGDIIKKGKDQNSSYGVRPTLHIPLSSSLYSYAGTVCSDGTVNEDVKEDIVEDKDKDEDEEEEEETSVFNSQTGDVILANETVSAATANYRVQAEFAEHKIDGEIVTLGLEGDTAYVVQKYRNGKLKEITISNNDLSRSKVTLNANVKLTIPVGFFMTGATKAVSGSFVNGGPHLKRNAKNQVVLKPDKGVSVYKFTLSNGEEQIIVYVRNFAFDQNIKKIALSQNQVVTIRPTLLNDKATKPNAPANMLNGTYQIGKKRFSNISQTITDDKTGSKVTLNANGTLTITNFANKGSIKVTYFLNGKKYTTSVRAVGNDQNMIKKAYKYNYIYEKAGLLK